MKLYWLDLETTGLSPHRDTILEIAMSVSDLADPFNLHHLFHEVFYFDPANTRVALDPFVVDMHTRNGLFEACKEARRTVREAEDELVALVPVPAAREDAPVLAGSGVHFDRAFLANYMPLLERRFSHRHFDVSSIKLFCQALGMDKIPKGEAHRACDDVRESAAHARECRRWLVQTPQCLIGPPAENERDRQAALALVT